MLNQIRNLFSKPADNSAYIHSSFNLLSSYLPDEAMLNGELQYATRPRVCLKDATASFAHGNERLELKAHLRALELDLEQYSGSSEALHYRSVTDLFYKHKLHLSSGLGIKEFLNLLPTDRNAMFRDDPQAMQVVNHLNDGDAHNLQLGNNASTWLLTNHPSFVAFLRRTCFPGRRPKWDKIEMLEASGIDVWCNPTGLDINLRYRNHTFSI